MYGPAVGTLTQGSACASLDKTTVDRSRPQPPRGRRAARRGRFPGTGRPAVRVGPGQVLPGRGGLERRGGDGAGDRPEPARQPEPRRRDLRVERWPAATRRRRPHQRRVVACRLGRRRCHGTRSATESATACCPGRHPRQRRPRPRLPRAKPNQSPPAHTSAPPRSTTTGSPGSTPAPPPGRRLRPVPAPQCRCPRRPRTRGRSRTWP